jgi:VWFA-related protein
VKKVSLSCAIILLSLGSIFSLVDFFYITYHNYAFAAGTPQINQNTSQSNLSKTMQPDPWTRLTLEPSIIKIYSDRVVPPDSILTFTFKFGNKGTLPMDSVTVLCYPPNMSLPVGDVPLTRWMGEVSKGPVEISEPTIYPSSTDPTLVNGIRWHIRSILPAFETTIDTNQIVFKLSVMIPEILGMTDASLDLQCWMGLFYDSNLNRPVAFDVVTIRVEIMPDLEIKKSVGQTSILPGSTNTITILSKNNSKRDLENVIIRDFFSSSSGNVTQCIEIVSIDTPAIDNTLPDIEWQNLKYEKQMSDWKRFVVTVRAKPFEDLKSLFNGSAITIKDVVSIEYGVETFDRDSATFRIVARDLESRLEPKLFGNYASPGFPLLLHGWIKNIGSTPVYGDPYEVFRVRIWLNDQRNTPFYDVLIKNRVEAGDSIYIAVESPPLPEGDGEYKFYIEVDYQNQIVEIVENNNIDSVTVVAKLESFKTTVNNVTRADQVTIFGKQPAFPNPIFSYVMITDQNYHYIRGLADPTRWLAPENPTPLGETVQQVWSPILEYHEEDPNIPDPAVQDVYLHDPDPNVTRIDENHANGFSVALIIDGNIIQANISNANNAARTLIQQMRPQDQMAVIKFSDRDLLIKNFTNNKLELDSAITQTFPTSPTHRLYDAIYNSINATVQQQGRKAVFIYTSAKNNGSSHGLNEVINHADSSGVPVFVFGFGNAEIASLQQLADKTGGLFIYEKETRDMWYIFKMFAEMFKNHYVLEHTTTDTTFDGTWRLVDVTANYPSLEFTDTDNGKYKAPNIGVDLFIIKEAETDSFSIGGIDTIRYVDAGESFTYRISFGNLGSIPGQSVLIKDILPDSVDVVAGSFSRQPDSTAANQHQLFWKYDTINPGDKGSISFDVRVKRRMPPWQVALIDSAFIIHDQDRKSENNLSVNIVYAVAELPDPPILRATPEKIRPRDPITVELQCFEELREWDIKVYFEDGSVIDTYADSFIVAHPILLPVEAIDQWHRIIPNFTDTRKRTDKSQEKITFKMTAKNVYGQSFEPEDFVIVEASFEFIINPIIIKPGIPGGKDRAYITLTLPADHTVTVNIYNVAGELVRKLDDKFFFGGERYVDALSWDARDDSGNLVASDVYIIVVKAGSHVQWQKVVVIR